MKTILRRKGPKRNKDGRANVRISSTSAAILAGEEDLTAWDDEELLRGQRRAKNGTWQGKPPQVIPKAIHNELVSRRMETAQALLRENLVAAIETLTTIAKDPEAENSDRIKASQLIIERVMGKTPEKITLAVGRTGEYPWQRAARLAIVGSLTDDKDVVEGEIVEEK